MQRCRLVPALLLLLALEAQAGIYKCQGPDGRLSFSSQPCPAQEQQIEHRLTAEEREQRRLAEEKQRQVDAAASRSLPQRQAHGLDEAATPHDAYDRLMQKLAGQVYRRAGPPAGPTAGPTAAAQPESSVDQLISDLVRNMEQGLTFDVEPGSTFDAVSNSPVDASVRPVAAYLAAKLHNPGSLEVIEWGPVLKVIKIDKQDFSSRKEYRVRLRFRAKNGLGRHVPLDQVFILDTSATVLRVADFDGRPLQDY
jgi:hypothetical protein